MLTAISAESVVEFEEASLERKTAAKERLDLQTERKGTSSTL
jgi:hypothetical protein